MPRNIGFAIAGAIVLNLALDCGIGAIGVAAVVTDGSNIPI
jgi:hypothetical protein